VDRSLKEGTLTSTLAPAAAAPASHLWLSQEAPAEQTDEMVPYREHDIL
jgi:hypothetical protein